MRKEDYWQVYYGFGVLKLSCWLLRVRGDILEKEKTCCLLKFSIAGREGWWLSGDSLGRRKGVPASGSGDTATISAGSGQSHCVLQFSSLWPHCHSIQTAGNGQYWGV